MNANFQDLMSEATRLTRAGQLLDATAAIQRALAGGAAESTQRSESGVRPGAILEGEFRVIEPEMPPRLRAPEVVVPSTAKVHAPAVAKVHAPSVDNVRAPHLEKARTPSDRGQFRSGSHAYAGQARDYKLYVPTSYAGQPMPLIVMLHGCTQHPDDFATGTRMNAIAEEQGLLVLYPAQSKQANASRCWNWFEPGNQRRGAGEPALLADMTRAIVRTHSVDARRVYVAGLSAGGAMAVIMGHAYPDLFAAAGVHSGLPYASAHDVKSAFAVMKNGRPMRALQRESPGADDPAAHLPIILFHGDRDTTVHPRNAEMITRAQGEPAGVPPRGSLRTTVENGQVPGGRAYTRSIHHDANGKTVAEHWLIHGAGHAWSGGDDRGSFTDPHGPDAAREMMRFFATQSLAADRRSGAD